jgi:uncharacterized protein YbgA (DUF1722 family)/uncharacterized protein YbbK (DUF523 family)
MREHARPTVVMSKCLELEACRYNGQSIRAPFVLQFMPFVELQPTCPEVEIGLGIPRDPIRLVALKGVQRLVQPTTGRDVTEDMRTFNDRYLGGLGEVDGFILKSRSPSCGIKDTKIYSGEGGTQPSDRGPGMFGGAVLERFPRAAVEDEGRLTNLRLRHHFLTKIFALAALRGVRRSGSMAELVRFHTENKFLLMAYHQTELRALGRIVANPDKKRPFAETIAAYEEHFAHALTRPARTTSHVNVLQHAMGYVSEGLGAGEKRHFLELLGEYKKGRATLETPLTLLQSWIARFEEPYLVRQRYLEPYPRELMDLRDSGRGQ